MATVKAVSSKCGIGGIIDYVTKEEKTESKLLYGHNCSVDTVKDEMQATKEAWGKTGGRTYKHFVISFHKDEKVTPQKAYEMGIEFVKTCPQFKGFEVFMATHIDREHMHTHFILNSVSFEDGHKFRMHKSELQQMKDLSDEICSRNGMHICQKGKTFHGAEREETSAYTKEAYQLLKKAEQGEVQSYVQDIALKVLECKSKAKNKQEFVDMMKDKGVRVEWQDSHKYITFTDLEREQQGEKKCKVRNNKLEKYYNMDFGKESLENEFEINLRSQERTERAREQLGADRGTEQAHQRVAVEELRARERVAEQERANRELEREARENERKRLNSEKERAFRSKEQVFGTRNDGFEREYRSHDRGR